MRDPFQAQKYFCDPRISFRLKSVVQHSPEGLFAPEQKGQRNAMAGCTYCCSTWGFLRGGDSQPRGILIQISSTIFILYQTLVRKTFPLTFLSPCFSNKNVQLKTHQAIWKLNSRGTSNIQGAPSVLVTSGITM